MSASQEQQVEKTCVNPGNPVFSCTMTPEVKAAPELGTTLPNLLYKTTSSAYGLHSPTFESSPCTFHPKSQRFSEELAKTGMYRESTLNTALDRSRVPKL